MDYALFSVEAFAADEAFQNWVAHPDPASTRFWEDFLARYPHKADEVAEARRLVLLWRTVTPSAVGDDDVADLRAAIFARVTVTPDRVTPDADVPVLPLHPTRPWWQRPLPAVAACALLLLALAAVWLLRAPAWVEEATAYGQIRRLTLPDGSVVTLNAHSSLRYREGLDRQAVREVYLAGEGYFSVRHTPDHRPFRVHTGRMRVDVLGTEFNVSDRRDAVRVVLESGKVRVQVDDRPGAQATLRPGDLVELPTNAERLVQRRVRAAAFSAWRQHRWELRREPLAQVALRLEETFGVRVVFARDADRQRLVSGDVPTQDLTALCDILGETLGLRFARRGNELLISEPL